MAHHVYATEGIVLRGIETGEWDRYYKILTPSLGLVGAVARGVRKEESKFRHTLEGYGHAHFEFVRGRDVWRVVGVSNSERLPSLFALSREDQELVSRITLLLERLVRGEESNPVLYDTFLQGLMYLSRASLPTPKLRKALELVWVLRILSILGYIDRSTLPSPFLEGPITESLLNEAFSQQKELVRVINRALFASQL